MTLPPGRAQEDTAVGELDGLAGWVAELIESMGPIGVGLLVFLEAVFPPLPSEAVLPAAGYLSSVGDLGFGVTLAAATTASVAGACVFYALGAALGEHRIRRLAVRLPLVDEADVDDAWGVFHRWRSWAVLLGRLVPGVRAGISIPAGADRMPLGRFVVLTAIGATGWNGTLMSIGWLLGDRFGATRSVSNWLDLGLLATALIPIVFFVNKRRRAHRAHSDRPARR